MKKRIISLFLSLALALSIIPAATAANSLPFRDVPGDAWYYDSVCYAYENGLMVGTSSTQFSPSMSLTRGMLVTVLGRVEGIIPGDYQDGTFNDVPANAYYAPYVNWAHEMGITSGVGNGRFAPNNKITRQELAAMLTRFIKRLDYELIPQSVVVDAYTDADQIAPWARDEVEYMRETGMFVGSDTGAFEPLSATSRAQMAVLLQRLVESIYFEVGGFAFIDFYADVTDILVGTTEDVTFTAQLENEEILPSDSVKLCDSDDRVIASMHDDGLNGDDMANDGIFVAQVPIEATAQGVHNYHAAYEENESSEFGISFYVDLTEDQLTAGDRVMEALTDIASRYTSTGDEETDAATYEALCAEITAYLDAAVADGTIVSYSKKSDGFHFVTPGNLEYIFLDTGLRAPATTNAAAAAASEAQSEESAAPSYEIDTTSQICLLEPFDWQHSDSAVDNAAADIINTGLDYELTAELENQNVTVETMRNLGQYHVILMHSHGGENSICTGQVRSAAADDQYSQDLQARRIRKVGVSNDATNRTYYAVSDNFFTTYYRAGDFNNSLIYIGTCHGADAPELTGALIRAGAKSVLAYENSVYTTYCQNMCEELVEQLCKQDESTGAYNTIEDALTAAKGVLGATDRSGADAAELQLVGSTDFRLSSGFISGDVVNAITGEDINTGRASTFGTLLGAFDVLGADIKEGCFGLRASVGTHRVSVSSYGYLTRTVVNVRVNQSVTTYLSTSRLVPATATNTSISGKITDAVTGSAVSNATIRFRKYHNNNGGAYVKDSDGNAFTITSSSNGSYSTSALPIGYYTMEVTKDGYIDQYADIVVGAGDYNEVSISPTMSSGEYRVVLTWGETPRDLDSHLRADGVHVYYSSKVADFANLDVDDTSSYGPETVTITDLPSLGGFTYLVHDFTNRSQTSGATALAASEAVVKVYQGNTLLKSYTVPTNGQGTVWKVFGMSASGRITDYNTFSYESSPSSVGT